LKLKSFFFKILFVVILLIGACNLYAQKQITWQLLDTAALQIDSLVYKKVGGKQLSLYYFLPQKPKLHKKYPAIVFIHGGAWTGGSAATFYSYAAYFSQRNITAISIDYRLIKDRSDDIVNCISDCKSAIRFIKKNAQLFQIDTSKLVICGESAGGHLAASMQLLEGYNDPGDDLRFGTKAMALVLLNPVVNLAVPNFIKYVDALDLLTPKNGLDSAALFQKNQAKAVAISPLFQNKTNFPPTLLINGVDDKVTPVLYAQAFADSVNRYQNQCKIFLLPNVGHAFAVPHYKYSELIVVNTVKEMDLFLQSLHLIKGKSNLIIGNDTNWTNKH